LTVEFGNAASRNHVFGWRAEAAVETARKQVAELIGASEKEIIFTSGATESDNLAIKGSLEHYRDQGDHVVTTTIEHRAVLDTCQRIERQRREADDEFRRLRLAELRSSDAEMSEVSENMALANDPVLRLWESVSRRGGRVTYVAVGPDGLVDPKRIDEAITGGTVVVSVMFANNEIGTVQPIEEIGALCHKRGVVFHCDAVQGLGTMPFNVDRMNVDLVSIRAHKLYGPKGVGALYVRGKPRVRVAPIIDGGGHEKGMRSGTLNVAAIVGFGAACDLARLEMKEEHRRILGLRERLRKELWNALDGLTLNGSLAHRLPGNLNISFSSVEAEALMIATKDELAISSGSACTSASLEPSYVLRACGVADELAHSTIRFGIGRFNTEAEIDHVSRIVTEKVRTLRALRTNSLGGTSSRATGASDAREERGTREDSRE
jgi:cysteine desulfurase